MEFAKEKIGIVIEIILIALAAVTIKITKKFNIETWYLILLIVLFSLLIIIIFTLFIIPKNKH